MKKFDIFLLIFVLVSTIILLFSGEIKIGLIFKLLIAALIVCLFLYTKIKPIKGNLNPGLKKTYLFIEKYFDKFFGFLGKIINPVVIGTNVSIDLSQIIILIILLIILLL
jgi:hypothetical protein